MSVKNVIEIPIVPYRLSDATVTDKNQYMLFASLATNDSPGTASFDSQDFKVVDGKVSMGKNYPFRGEKKRLLASDANGVNTIDLEYDRSAKGDAIVQRDWAGHVHVPTKTNNESAAISLKQAKELFAHDLESVNAELESVNAELATKLDKSTERNIVYATNYQGNPMTIPVNTQIVPGGLVVRNTVTGDVLVPFTPEYPQSATSRDYVNSLSAALDRRVRSLEGLTLTHIEDSAPSHIIWTKVSPPSIGTPAFLKYIEGCTERVKGNAGKNVLNPKELTSQFDEWISEHGEECFSYVLNEDGSITYITNMGESGNPDRKLYINIEQFPAGVYFLYTNVTDDGHHTFSFDGTYMEIDVGAKWDDENEVYVPAERTLKVMLYLAEESDYWDVLDAEYDTNGPIEYQPYIEPSYSLVHRKPLQISSYSANLFGGSALRDAFVTNYPSKVTVDHANETMTLKAGFYHIPVPETVSRQNGPSVIFVVKGQGNFYWSADGAELEIYNEDSPDTVISTWSYGESMSEIYIEARSNSTIYYEECGTFISAFDGTGISDVSDFQLYREEPVGELLLPEIADFDLGVGIDGYFNGKYVHNCNSFSWNEKLFVATERAREIVLDGSEDWINVSGAYFALTIGEYGMVVPHTAICDRYEVKTPATNGGMCISVTNSNSYNDARIMLRTNEGVNTNMSVEEFKAQLAEKPVRIVVALAKPNTIVEDVENVSNEIDTCPYSVFRFFDAEGAEMDTVVNTIVYVVRRGGVNNVDGE